MSAQSAIASLLLSPKNEPYYRILREVLGIDVRQPDFVTVVGGEHAYACDAPYADTTLEWKLRPTRAAANAHKTMHGGFLTYICDTLTGLHLSLHHAGRARDEGRSNHVSVSINMTFLRGVPVEEDIIVRTRIKKLGARLAFMSADVAAASHPDRAACHCEHTKCYVRSSL